MNRQVFNYNPHKEDSKKELNILLNDGWKVVNSTSAPCASGYEAKYYPVGLVVYILEKQ